MILSAEKKYQINKTYISFQRKKKPKEKPAASVQAEEVVAKEAVAVGQEPPCPAARKRRRRPLKAGTETGSAEKVRLCFLASTFSDSGGLSCYGNSRRAADGNAARRYTKVKDLYTTAKF